MAGVITHMVIAKEMLQFLPAGAVKDPGLFVLGSIAPDAVHAREDYERAHKKHTHFRDEIPDSDFEQPDNFALYRNRLAEFILANKDREDGLLDLYRGYVVHIMTDEMFVLTIRKEFSDAMKMLGIDQKDRPFFDNIVTDMNRNDLLLVDQYEGMAELKAFIEEVPIYPIDGYISRQEMSICRDWLIHQHFTLQQEQLQPLYISHERMLAFIRSAAEQIADILTKGIHLPRML